MCVCLFDSLIDFLTFLEVNLREIFGLLSCWVKLMKIKMVVDIERTFLNLIILPCKSAAVMGNLIA